MATKPSTVPGWVPTGTTPSAGQKTAGFATNGPLPAAWQNWFWTLVSGWVAYLRDGVIVGEASEPGLTVTAGSGNEIGIVTTGTGTGAGLTATGGATGNGVEGTGGGTSGIGVKGTGVGGSRGGEFFGGSSNGEGLQATGGSDGRAATFVAAGSGGTGVQIDVSGGSHAGLYLVGNATRAQFRMTPQASAPTGPNIVGDFYVDTAGILYSCTTAGTPGTFTKVGTQT